MTAKSFSGWLLVSLFVGAGLGGYGMFEWKERELAGEVAEAIKTEQDRQGPLRQEVEALKAEVERQRLLLELSAIAVEVERKNFGLAHERLVVFGDDLETLATRLGASQDPAVQAVLTRQEELAARLEALDPGVALELHQLSGDLRRALDPLVS
ncbi:MAG: hypothetical protein AAF560_14065 [Acidobacteriota bacterium]